MSSSEGLVNALVSRAQLGDRSATALLIAREHKRVQGLARRMLASEDDARDATQDILLQVLTGLRGFRGESAFSTWVYRIALNHLKAVRQRAARARIWDEAEPRKSEPTSADDDAEEALMMTRLRSSYCDALDRCLDSQHSAALILVDVLECDHAVSAAFLGIEQVAFRKRLSRAREQVVRSIQEMWGLSTVDA